LHQGDISVYVKNIDLISLRQKYYYKEHEGKTMEKEGHKLLLDGLKLAGINKRDNIPKYRDISQL
jgi:hypothetical protein